MTFILKDRVRESTVTVGTSDFALGGAVSGYRAFSSVLSNGDTTWYACVLPGSAWEVGIGTWITGNTLQRTTVLDSSNAAALVNFGSGTKDVFIALPAQKGNVANNVFPSGTLMLFQQTNAPLYWTKQVTHNDKALRVVSGAASSGGAVAFSSALSSQAVSNTTITQSTMASHAHNYTNGAFGSNNYATGSGFAENNSTTSQTSSIGGDQPHNHTINLNVLYVDLIIASKD
jgi:hypothetical protein